MKKVILLITLSIFLNSCGLAPEPDMNAPELEIHDDDVNEDEDNNDGEG